MVPVYESTALLVLMAVLVAEHGVGVRLGAGADCLVAAVGAATYVEGVHLSAAVVALWLAVAATAGDQVARLGGTPPQRDPLHLLGRARTTATYAAASVATAAAWTTGLVVVGRVVVATLV
ncbi:hypothetical protein GCM10009795_061170 [Nocardioides hankookensis]|uniref:Integral membrane protein n=1 Tax=Nocardioides hankookensis TaxID=443157 RepID=A0ABW1LN81_9ACTN